MSRDLAGCFEAILPLTPCSIMQDWGRHEVFVGVGLPAAAVVLPQHESKPVLSCVCSVCLRVFARLPLYVPPYAIPRPARKKKSGVD